MIVNLLGNALKFTERGEVAVSVLTEERSAGKTTLHFVVADTGIGIPIEKRQLIFDAFAQEDASMSRKYGGTGLGLTISSKLVKMMGGRIWVESEPGERQPLPFHRRSRSGPGVRRRARGNGASPGDSRAGGG